MRRMIIKEKIVVIIELTLIFLFFLCFFSVIHPIVLSDTDDWAYANCFRDAIPKWGGWNPTRVFAEVFMPFVTKIGVYIIKPFGLNIFRALTISYAFFISFFITLLSYAFFRVFLKLYSFWIAVFTSIMFLLFHFWAFRKYENENIYMFGTRDACTYFYYVIPNILNTILVLWIVFKPEICNLFLANDLKCKSIFFLALYYGIFSNIWGSIIFAAFLSGELLIDVVKSIKLRKGFRLLLKNDFHMLIILTIWILSQFMELSGGRASVVNETDFCINIKQTLVYCYELLKSISSSFLVFTAVIVIGAFVNSTARNGLVSLLKKCFLYIWSAAVVFVYLVLSNAKVDPEYVLRPDVFYGLFTFLCFIELTCFAEIMEQYKILMVYMPVIITIIFFNIDTKGKTFAESTLLNEEPETVNYINNYIVDQFLEAQLRGEDTIKLYVPKYESEDNWPYATYAGSTFSYFMYEYGITEKYISVSQIVPLDE